GDIFYDIIWNSGSNSVALEFGAHVEVGQDGLDINIGTNVGYGVARGASNISGGPYHVKLDNWLNGEGNIGNLDNQLQGSQILLIPQCNITGNPLTDLCPNASNFSLNGHPTNLDNATFSWSFLHNHTGATIVG